MSPRNLRRFWLASTVAAIAWVGGCDDGESSPIDEMDAGDHDAGDPDPKPDGGMPEEDAGTNACEMECADNRLATVTMPGCCIEESGVCGLEIDSLKQIDPAFTLTGCYERDRKGEPSEDHCGAFFDQIDQMANKQFDLELSTGALPFAACCTPQGECGVSLSETTISANGQTRSYNLHLGCVGFRELQEALGDSADAGVGDPLKLDVLPFCNPSNGAAPTEGTIPGVPAFVCGCGEDTPYTDQTVPCLSRLPTSVCGADAPKAEELAEFPAFACGCGEGELAQAGQLPCINNVAKETCGTGAIDDALQLVPEYVCGCGEDEIGNGTCLNKTAPTTCGKQPFEGTAVPGVPEYACGCGDDVVASGCIPNVPQGVCGAEPFSGERVPGVGKHACGCGDGVVAANCIPNVPKEVCGDRDPTTDELKQVPDFMCGCGEAVRALGRPCISETASTVCGTAPLAPGDIATLPGRLCGCGDAVTYDPETFPVPCFSKQATNSCGGGDPLTEATEEAPACITDVAAYVRGCGQTVPSYPPTCVANVDVEIFGCHQPDAGRAVPGQPAYACGCGVGEERANCIPNVGAAVCGALDPTAEQLGTLPDFYCGCGSSTPAMGRPCLSYLALDVCGTVDIPPSLMDPPLPSNLCGCGAEVTYDPATMELPCLSKQATDSCGSGD